MYLKSIEVQGFKSFANKIVFDFHNGITGIVGPNGSGKSNVADAVRWVLGEQSAKQLRGTNMQDVIFSGTQNRKPLSYASVSITMDNSDHKLAIDFAEVTVTRRVYRSGESEYLMNGNLCRLKDVTELFYDTGIGKEGYSIIGQGQIERILNGRPEERRELFDEAAGIVKYKKRKAAAWKKLENERENLVRVNDILSELERQVAPLEKQAQKARIYLKEKEQLKVLDANWFLLEEARMKSQMEEVQQNYSAASEEYENVKKTYEAVKAEYKKLEQDISAQDEKIECLRVQINETAVIKNKLENQIELLKEQIRFAKQTDLQMQTRLESIAGEKEERQRAFESYDAQKCEFDAKLEEIEHKKQKAQQTWQALKEESENCKTCIQKGQNDVIALLGEKAAIQQEQQRFDTMEEQLEIRRAQLNQKLLKSKTQEADFDAVLADYEKELEQIRAQMNQMQRSVSEMEEKKNVWNEEIKEIRKTLEETMGNYHKQQSKLESLRNIAERYDGYGMSIRKVMEQKEKEKGLLGVVSDLIQVDKKYETAIETALGGNIQNIVTENEETAKKMIAYLKKYHFGRATFLPLTSVNGKGNFKQEDALKEPGVIGLANTLVMTEKKYEGVISYLLGRVIVTNQIDDAISLAKKYHYSLHIVTLEGEYLSPGGSMTGGAFKGSSSLLARNREIEELEKKTKKVSEQIKEKQIRLNELLTAQTLLEEEIEQEKQKIQKQYILQNTANLQIERTKQQKKESGQSYEGLQSEFLSLQQQLAQVEQNKTQIAQKFENVQKQREQIEEENKKQQLLLDGLLKKEQSASNTVSEISLEMVQLRQKLEFVLENRNRILTELERFEKERESVCNQAGQSKKEAGQKQREIEKIQKTIAASFDRQEEKECTLKEYLKEREEMSVSYKGFFEKQEEISQKNTNLDKELFRLNHQREKLEEALHSATDYLWAEYELTPHSAMELKKEEFQNSVKLKKQITLVKEEIRKLGDVNVNAIEDFKEVFERYTFLKGQHDDLIEAEKTLQGIVEDLDTAMRKQFLEKFAEIQSEFDKVFKELFGGGKGTLELVEDEDILECGIRISAQPPGKKLQNMMQMSGGEKALTAISLLFAIQNLKPSPFCLLDEIEAALDDSNVGRFADYLHKLTKNTQFIVITHRRGTMGAADRLYGITMQEKGVSALVSVNLITDDLEK